MINPEVLVADNPILQLNQKSKFTEFAPNVENYLTRKKDKDREFEYAKLHFRLALGSKLVQSRVFLPLGQIVVGPALLMRFNQPYGLDSFTQLKAVIDNYAKNGSIIFHRYPERGEPHYEIFDDEIERILAGELRATWGINIEEFGGMSQFLELIHYQMALPFEEVSNAVSITAYIQSEYGSYEDFYQQLLVDAVTLCTDYRDRSILPQLACLKSLRFENFIPEYSKEWLEFQLARGMEEGEVVKKLAEAVSGMLQGLANRESQRQEMNLEGKGWKEQVMESAPRDMSFFGAGRFAERKAQLPENVSLSAYQSALIITSQLQILQELFGKEGNNFDSENDLQVANALESYRIRTGGKADSEGKLDFKKGIPIGIYIKGQFYKLTIALELITTLNLSQIVSEMARTLSGLMDTTQDTGPNPFILVSRLGKDKKSNEAVKAFSVNAKELVEECGVTAFNIVLDNQIDNMSALEGINTSRNEAISPFGNLCYLVGDDRFIFSYDHLAGDGGSMYSMVDQLLTRVSEIDEGLEWQEDKLELDIRQGSKGNSELTERLESIHEEVIARERRSIAMIPTGNLSIESNYIALNDPDHKKIGMTLPQAFLQCLPNEPQFDFIRASGISGNTLLTYAIYWAITDLIGEHDAVMMIDKAHSLGGRTSPTPIMSQTMSESFILGNDAITTLDYSDDMSEETRSIFMSHFGMALDQIAETVFMGKLNLPSALLQMGSLNYAISSTSPTSIGKKLLNITRGGFEATNKNFKTYVNPTTVIANQGELTNLEATTTASNTHSSFIEVSLFIDNAGREQCLVEARDNLINMGVGAKELAAQIEKKIALLTRYMEIIVATKFRIAD